MKTWQAGTIVWCEEDGIAVGIETSLTPELIEEGKVADIKRWIQDDRKRMGLQPGEELKQYIYTSKDSADKTTAQKASE